MPKWTASSKNPEETDGLHFAFRWLRGLWSAVWYLGVFAGLSLYVLRDFVPSRKSKPLTVPMRIPRKLPRLYREGSDVFMWMPDGSTVALDAMEVSIMHDNISDVVAGAYVYEKTRLPHKDF